MEVPSDELGIFSFICEVSCLLSMVRQLFCYQNEMQNFLKITLTKESIDM